MFVNILFFTFVSVFVAVVAFGHVLLFNAIWPDVFRRREPHLITVARVDQESSPAELA